MKSKMEIVKRAVCLLCYVDRCSLEDTVFDGIRRSLEEREKQRSIIIKWLKEKGYYAFLTNKEKEIIETPVMEETNTDVLICHSDYECIEPLLWSIGLVNSLSNYDGFILDNLHIPLKIGPKHSMEKLAEYCKSVSKKRLIEQREIAMLWYWRCLESRSSSSKMINYFDEINRTFGAKSIGILEEYELFDRNKCDFVVKGKIISELGDEELAILELIAEKRLYAFEWLCTDTEWDNIDLIC